MVRAALAALSLAAALAAAAAPDPCCLRVTPYHIQALAQRMAQRFQALEYRAQDLRYVFASFQAVHGNVSHRLRYLEAEHVHLSQLVGRLDARVQALEADKRMEQYRQHMAYYSRGPRHSPVRTPVDDLMKALRRRRNENQTELPHLFVHLDQSKESFEADGSISFTRETTLSPDTTANHPSPSEMLPQQLTPVPELVHQNPNVHSEVLTPTVSADSERPTPHTPVFLAASSEPPPQLRHDAPSSDSVTTPTPLWQLEETASALLNVMSAGDDDVDVPADNTDGAVSYWTPANETDSLEELFNPLHRLPTPRTVKCSGQTMTNCSEEKPGLQSSGGASNLSTDATVSNSANSSSHSGLFGHDAVTLPNTTLASGNGSENATSERESAEVATTKTSGCKTPPSSALPVGEIPVPSDNATNLTRLLLDTGNDTGSLADVLFAPGASLAPDGGGGAGSAELSDAELQAALRELDALLQRPPAAAQPPDPEKVLLKRALTLALAALERTSDACLKLVNFTADAFEGMAATEA